MSRKIIINLLHTNRCVFWDLMAVGCEGERRVKLDQNRALWQASVLAHCWPVVIYTWEMCAVSCYLGWGVSHRFKYFTILGRVFPAISSLLRQNHKCFWGPRCGKLRCLLVFPATFSVTYLFDRQCRNKNLTSERNKMRRMISDRSTQYIQTHSRHLLPQNKDQGRLM